MPDEFHQSQFTVLPKLAVLTCQQLQVDPYRTVASSRTRKFCLKLQSSSIALPHPRLFGSKTLLTAAVLTGVIHRWFPSTFGLPETQGEAC